ncbi:MAG: hypothetical protein LUE08_04095 [Akkermansiaceae bacterium]|nr:hypothetical protein [Akkermansiaceae bacterium]
MSKTIATTPGLYYTTTFTAAGTVTAETPSGESVQLASGSGQVSWQAVSGEAIVSDDSAVTLPVRPAIATEGSGSISGSSSTITVDQTYDAASTNAQSGTAVAEALGTLSSATWYSIIADTSSTIGRLASYGRKAITNAAATETLFEVSEAGGAGEITLSAKYSDTIRFKLYLSENAGYLYTSATSGTSSGFSVTASGPTAFGLPLTIVDGTADTHAASVGQVKTYAEEAAQAAIKSTFSCLLFVWTTAPASSPDYDINAVCTENGINAWNIPVGDYSTVSLSMWLFPGITELPSVLTELFASDTYSDGVYETYIL